MDLPRGSPGVAGAVTKNAVTLFYTASSVYNVLATFRSWASPEFTGDRRMSKPFDATIKDLAAQGPVDFVTCFDGPTTHPVTLLNVDLSTVTTAADVVFAIGDPLTEILHLDAQAGPSATKHLDVLAYNVLLHRTYQVPVHSSVLLLRPQAEHPNLTGSVQYAARPGRGKMDFGYEVIRLWEMPADDLLNSALATAPLAVLGKLPEALRLEDALAAVIKRLVQRLQQEAAGKQAERLLTAAYILTGLRLRKPEDVVQLFQGVSIAMRESVTYQAILEEGRVEELHRTVLRQGRERFGDADETARQEIEAISDIEVLEDLSVRLLRVSSWAELLA
jgi:predicted transposase YdaD